jgi:hypothetical protein
MISVSTSSGCSLLFTTKAPPNAANLPPMAAVECTSSKIAPIVDTGVALAMGSTIFSRITGGDDASADVVINREADIGIAAGVALLFIASSAYGYHVTGSCHAVKRGHLNAPVSAGAFPAQDEEDRSRSRRRSREPAPAAAVPSAWEAPLGLPKTVGGFAFSTPPAEAEKVCAASGRVWESQGVNANCNQNADGSGVEVARLEFDLGSLTKIAIVYAPAESSFNKSYDSLHAKLKARYGKPQIWRTPLSGDCATALPDCMKRGETFAGSTWSLSSGRVELVPVWRGQHAFIEERYIREEAPPK